MCGVTWGFLFLGLHHPELLLLWFCKLFPISSEKKNIVRDKPNHKNHSCVHLLGGAGMCWFVYSTFGIDRNTC